MNILDIKGYDVVNGPGIRMSIWTAGCNNHCKGCWAQHTWNPLQGRPTSECMKEIEEILKTNDIDGVSILGGDPLFSTFNEGSSDDLIAIIDLCKSYGKSVWVWSGYSLDDIYHADKRVLEKIDVLVEGKYDESKRDLNLFYRGSSNQRVIFMEAPSDGVEYKHYVLSLLDDGYSLEECNGESDK